jgi:predicted RNase H-like HicB family nuclease
MAFNLFTKKIDQELVLALRWKLPESLNVTFQKAEEGGFNVVINNFPGCFTQADNEKQVFEMVNDAVLTYLDIPEEYQPYMPSFFPEDDALRKAILNDSESTVVLQRA